MPLNVHYREFAFGSDTYPKAVELRRSVLRAPLGLSWERGAFDGEDRSIHLGGFLENELIATLVLKPVDGATVKMRQVAVAPHVQSKGMGSGLLRFAEEEASKRGFVLMCAHARESALNFYLRHGYAVSGSPFIEVTVPHCYVSKRLTRT